MKGPVYILSVLFFLLLSCSDSDKLGDNGCGFLELRKLEVSVDGEVLPLSRTVDAGLQVQIWQNGKMVEGQDYAPGSDFSRRITLPVGTNYTVRAFTPDQEEADNDVVGHPVFSVESESFEVKEADITTVALVAPQVNVGVKVGYDDFVVTNFTDISIVFVSESGRSVTITGTENQQIYYFKIPSSGLLTYTLQATNADGENMSKTETLAVTAKNYDIQVSI